MSRGAAFRTAPLFNSRNQALLIIIILALIVLTVVAVEWPQ